MSRKRSNGSREAAVASLEHDDVDELDLMSAHKKVTAEDYWSSNVWRLTMAKSLFALDDHDYAKASTTEDHAPMTDDAPADLIVEAPCSSSSSSEDVHATSLVVDEDASHSFVERRETIGSYTSSRSDDSGIDSCDSNFFAESEAVEEHQLATAAPAATLAVAKKRSCVAKKSRETLVSEESPVIEGDFEPTRRVTRQHLKDCGEKATRPKVEIVPGKMVWGSFRGGWWPAMIIKAEDAGMFASQHKIWVYWIGDKLISELPVKSVDSFSSDLIARFDSMASITVKSAYKKQRELACSRTIQMLRKEFPSGALIKPYTSWLRKSVLPEKQKLESLCFHPYPPNVEETLNELKKINCKRTEKYLREKEKERQSEAIETKTSTKKVEEIEKPVEEGGIDIIDQKPGTIVWAKIQGYSYWPCVIMDYQHLNKKQPNVAHQWVMWYGDYKYSQVEYRQILQFTAGMRKMLPKIKTTKDEVFAKGVLRACQDYGEQLEFVTDKWDMEYVVHLFGVSREQLQPKDEVFEGRSGEELYSATIRKQLRKQVKNQPVDEQRKRLILGSKELKLVLERKAALKSLCITCFKSGEKLEGHPIFHASMCSACLEDFSPRMFAYGNDGNCFYCTLCGDEDLIAMCDNVDCPRVFCTACIKYIICPDLYEEVLLRHPWYCFLCRPKSVEMKGSLLKAHQDWKTRLINVYRKNCDAKLATNFKRLGCRRKIRVLSLFDGIGTGFVVLKKLKIKIDRYYASEIDPDSMQVSRFNHGDKIIQLGDVREIDEKMIKEIAPIDLLIGGSPCNELSLANPKRRGLDDPEGTGVLFYDFVRVLNLCEKHNKNHHLFWLFENVASMPKVFRNQISENLGREPLFLDSADFSAQHRPRLYWGNLPWGPYQSVNVVLQDMLNKACMRQALVKKIMTVTTRMNSLNQTKENLKPVLMNGKKDMLWVTELEQIFGFPIHYTDANLQKTRRLQLIGKAWSVQTLVAILRPLFYF